MADRRRGIRIAAGGLALAAGMTACGAEVANNATDEEQQGVLYGVGDDHRLWRWETGADEAEPVFDLSGVWEHEGDVGTVLTASLSIAPDQSHAAWIAGGGPEAELQIGELASGEVSGTVPYPVDHACLDPAWAPDGASLSVHRADIWGGERQGDAMPTFAEAWGPTEWYSPDGERRRTQIDLGEGCRLRWYAADGETEGIYHDLAVSELYRVDETGERIETIGLDGLSGIDPQVTGLVDVDPTGRYVCLADGYAEHETYEGGFTIRPQSGTKVLDLDTGESVGADGAGCDSMAVDGYLSRDDTAVEFLDYDGESRWTAELPTELANAPNLFYFAEAP
ncbi:hypothetical protein [Glycomyces tarimensis]